MGPSTHRAGRLRPAGSYLGAATFSRPADGPSRQHQLVAHGVRTNSLASMQKRPAASPTRLLSPSRSARLTVATLISHRRWATSARVQERSRPLADSTHPTHDRIVARVGAELDRSRWDVRLLVASAPPRDLVSAASRREPDLAERSAWCLPSSHGMRAATSVRGSIGGRPPVWEWRFARSGPAG